MSTIFDPTRNKTVNRRTSAHGYVATLVQLPIASAKCEGNVVFCDEDKRFYECIHVVTDDEDYYRWTAVTSGGQRTFFIPVEGLNEKEFPVGEEPAKRTNSFDAIAAALHEMAIGLSRYNIHVDPFCFEPCSDKIYKRGQKYYVWHDNYDRADYILTQDANPIAGKPYFLEDEALRYVTVIFGASAHFDRSKKYFESTRPIMIEDPAYVEGGAIDHRVFVSNGVDYNKLKKPDLVAKANEIIDVINVTNAQLSKATDEGTLFANSWNHLLGRVSVLEENVKRGTSQEIPLPFPCFVKNTLGTFKLDVVATSGSPELKIDKI